MSHKKKHAGRVPPGNQPKAGLPAPAGQEPEQVAGGRAPAQEQDPKRRLGNYAGAGEHPYQQPGGRNDADQ